jgi:gluconokinase
VILSIDIGSSSVRALAYSARGESVPGVSSRRSHRYAASANGKVEADPEQLFAMVGECIDEALQRAADRGAGAWAGVAVCTFWHGLLGTNSDGAPLTPVITWADTRSVPQAAALAERLDGEAVRQRTGCQMHASYFPAKLSWFRQEEPAVFARADWWCSVGEYFFWRLFGDKRCSYSMASGSGLLDRAALRWDPLLLEHLSLPPERLSTLCDADEPSTMLLPPYVSRWPALSGVPWFPALGDGACSNLGAGCGLPGRLVLMVGTTGAMRIVRERAAVAVPRGLWAYLLDRSRMLLGGVLGDGGNLVEWMGDTLKLGRSPRQVEEALSAAAPAGHGLTVLPYLTGERSTGWNPLARGALAGLRSDTTSIDILQAGIEAVAYRFAAVRDRLSESAKVDGEIVASGGAMLASPAWCQIVADALDTPVACSAVEEASSRGAALRALEALGLYDTASMTPPVGRRFLPRPRAVEAHLRARESQEQLYGALYGSTRST